MDTAIENIRIRPLIPEDRDGVYTFFRNLGEEGTYFFNRNGGNERGTYQYLDGARTDHIFWAAVADTPEGEEIAGIVFLFKIDTKVPYLGIGISEQWKGRHLGRRLMTTAREWAQSVEAGGILLTTDTKNFRGQKLYERMGYKQIGTHPNGEILYLLALPNENTASVARSRTEKQ